MGGWSTCNLQSGETLAAWEAQNWAYAYMPSGIRVISFVVKYCFTTEDVVSSMLSSLLFENALNSKFPSLLIKVQNSGIDGLISYITEPWESRKKEMQLSWITATGELHKLTWQETSPDSEQIYIHLVICNAHFKLIDITPSQETQPLAEVISTVAFKKPLR